jgi:hypothetical protein
MDDDDDEVYISADGIGYTRYQLLNVLDNLIDSNRNIIPLVLLTRFDEINRTRNDISLDEIYNFIREVNRNIVLYRRNENINNIQQMELETEKRRLLTKFNEINTRYVLPEELINRINYLSNNFINNIEEFNELNTELDIFVNNHYVSDTGVEYTREQLLYLFELIKPNEIVEAFPVLEELFDEIINNEGTIDLENIYNIIIDFSDRLPDETKIAMRLVGYVEDEINNEMEIQEQESEIINRNLYRDAFGNEFTRENLIRILNQVSRDRNIDELSDDLRNRYVQFTRTQYEMPIYEMYLLVKNIFEFYGIENIYVDVENQYQDNQPEDINQPGGGDDDNEEYIFEDADDVNEADISNTTCYDIISTDVKDIVKHLNEEDTFLFINKGPNNIFDILCFEKSYIENIINDKNGNWFYECTGNLIENTNDKPMAPFGTDTYIKMYIDDTGFVGYIPLVQLKTLLRENNRIYYIYPLMDGDSQKMLTHTIGWQNSYGPVQNRNIMSANHCQSGSNALIYTLKLCKDPERCIKSILDNGSTYGETYEDIDDISDIDYLSDVE